MFNLKREHFRDDYLYRFYQYGDRLIFKYENNEVNNLYLDPHSYNL